MATLNGLKPELRLLQRKLAARDQRAVLALERHRHAHAAHLVLDRDLHADVEALARRDARRWHAAGSPGSSRRRAAPPTAGSCACRRARSAARRAESPAPACSRMAGSSMVSSFTGNLMSKRVCSGIVGDEHRARQLMRRDHVVVPEPRHGAAAIHEDLQQRLLGHHLVFLRAGGSRRSAAAGAGAGARRFGGRGACLTRRPAPIARGPRQRTRSGNRCPVAVYS